MVRGELIGLQQEGHIVEYKRYEDYEEEAKALGVTSVPTIIFFEEGKECNRAVGFRPASMLKDLYKGGVK